MIIEKYENPRHKISEQEVKKIAANYQQIKAASTSCMDNFEFYLKVEKEIIKDVRYFGEGCVISIAANETICDYVINKTLKQSLLTLTQFFSLVTEDNHDKLKNLDESFWVFDKLHLQPGRINCGSISCKAIIKFLKE